MSSCFDILKPEGRVRKAVSVLKKRSGPHEDAIRELLFLPTGIVVGEPLESFHGIITGMPMRLTASARLAGISDEPET
jgi:circadian clock protein KaiC